MSGSRIVVEPVCLNEHVMHLLLQELTRVCRPHFTTSDCRQYISLNDVFELGRQRCGRKIRQILDPLLHESLKLLSLAGRILTPYSSAIELLHSLYGHRGNAGIRISINPSLFWRNQQTKGILHGHHIPLEGFFGARKIVDCDLSFDDHDPAIGSGDENVWLKRHRIRPTFNLADLAEPLPEVRCHDAEHQGRHLNLKRLFWENARSPPSGSPPTRKQPGALTRQERAAVRGEILGANSAFPGLRTAFWRPCALSGIHSLA